jgi:alpha-D-xyloside xylohydrolase
MWSFDKVEPILLMYDKLRYRLMPYIYSLTWKVSSEDYTIQRPLVMDWRTDPNTWNVGDEFMFGPAILVSPVLKADVTKRSVYLPAAPAWYDFWSGQSRGAGEWEADAPPDRVPIFVRAGSIIPMGPEIQTATEDSGGPVELRIYRGADGSFSFYEDAGDGYAYEKNEHSVIPIRWEDRSGTLTIGARQGSFPGMIGHRRFRAILVSSGHGSGGETTGSANAEIDYDGKQVQTTIR